MKIVKPGMLTTIQDLGRCGYQKYGVIVSGAMDTFSLQIANILVGNTPDEAALEMTLNGPTIQFEEDVWLAVCGASLSPKLNGVPVPEWRPFVAKKGDELRFGKPLAGCRAYLAVAGGLQVAEVLGSKSTYLRANLGGFAGRALRTDDVMHAGSPPILPPSMRPEMLPNGADFAARRTVRWAVSPRLLPKYQGDAVVRFIRGPEYDLFAENSQSDFVSQPFVITPQSDRMGYRLEGPALSLHQPKEMLSSAVDAGTVQVPTDGRPIILMADSQTTGGYPRIAHVVSVDLPILAQLRPGNQIRFAEISLAEAQCLLRCQAREIARLRMAIHWKWRGDC